MNKYLYELVFYVFCIFRLLSKQHQNQDLQFFYVQKGTTALYDHVHVRFFKNIIN